jgi:tetratricopeptide (TPR) repeat protein
MQEAVKLYRDGIEALADSEDRSRFMLHSELADVYSLLDRPDDQLNMYEQILEADQNQNAVLTAIRGKYELDGDHAAALARHGKWRFSGEYPPSLGLWAWLLVSEPGEDGEFPDLNAALGYAQDASNGRVSHDGYPFAWPLNNYFRKREGTPTDYSGKNTLGMVHFRRREFPKALKALQEFYDLGFEEPGNWLFLAMTHWKLDNREEARKWLKKATDYLDQDGYRVRHSEKLFRAEAEELMGMTQEVER